MTIKSIMLPAASLLALLVAPVVVLASPPFLPPAQSVNGSLDGQNVVVALVPYRSINAVGNPEVGSFQLVVRKPGGRVLWTSPRGVSSNSPMSFMWGPAGEDEVQLVGDVDGAGSSELVVARPQSDVRAPTYRFFRWQHGAFTLHQEASVVDDHGVFRYSHNQVGHGLWVAHFKSASNGRVTATIEGTQGDRVVHGVAVLHPDVGGFSLVQYITPLSP